MGSIFDQVGKVSNAVGSTMAKIDKQIQDKAGYLNKVTIDSIRDLDLQWRNQFDILMFPGGKGIGSGLLGSAISSVGGAFSSLVGGAMDLQFVRKHAYAINIPMPKVEFERANERTYPKNIIQPDEFTITFIEDSELSVFDFITNWYGNMFEWSSSKQTYEFYDDQESCRKNIKVFFISAPGTPAGLFASIEGARPSGVNEITLSSSDGEPLSIQVTFTADRIEMDASLVGKIIKTVF